MIRVHELCVRFGDHLALHLPDLEIGDGQRLGIEGANGSGKSTLLRVLAGLVPPTSGTVEGAPPPGRAVLVHQHPYLFQATAQENVAYALRRSGRPVSDAARWLDRLGAGAFADRPARALSVGEQRRVAFARALAVEPELLLLDEPFAGLDEDGTAALVEALADRRGALVIAAPDLGELTVSRIVRLSGASRGRGPGTP